MGGKRVDFEGDEGKALAYLSACGYTAAEIERITGRSDDSIRRAIFIHGDSHDDMQKEANCRNIVRNGYFEITVMYLYGIGKKTSEISEYLGKCKASIREVKNRYKTREKVRSNRDILQSQSKAPPFEESSEESIGMVYDKNSAPQVRDYGHQETASPQEAAERAAQRQTQGRKGCKQPRIIITVTLDNDNYIRAMARVTGKSISDYVNSIIDSDKKTNKEIYDTILCMREQYGSG